MVIEISAEALVKTKDLKVKNLEIHISHSNFGIFFSVVDKPYGDMVVVAKSVQLPCDCLPVAVR